METPGLYSCAKRRDSHFAPIPPRWHTRARARKKVWLEAEKYGREPEKVHFAAKVYFALFPAGTKKVCWGRSEVRFGTSFLKYTSPKIWLLVSGYKPAEKPAKTRNQLPSNFDVTSYKLQVT